MTRLKESYFGRDSLLESCWVLDLIVMTSVLVFNALDLVESGIGDFNYCSIYRFVSKWS
jgi:hypothetical protein